MSKIPEQYIRTVPEHFEYVEWADLPNFMADEQIQWFNDWLKGTPVMPYVNGEIVIFAHNLNEFLQQYD
jgi:hypothetical protein